jgi:hypothetical protein
MRFLPCILLFALTLSGCQDKRDPLTSAQIFMQQISNGQAQEAYQSSTFGFQAQRTAAVFEKAAQDMGLVGYASAQWQTLERDGRTAKVPVVITTRTGQQLPIIVTLLDESGAWRVFSLKSPPSEQTGIAENKFTLVGKATALTNSVLQPTPPEEEVRMLVRDNLLRFNNAIATESFDEFYDSVSRKWQEQLTKGQLQRAFQPFIDKKVSIAAVGETEAVLDAAPSVNSEGLLLVSGSYPTQPYRIFFTLKFYYELPAWKLFGLEVNLRQ